ncbi:hypothetical protein Fot_04005 [Forsythia ovata]|uniref:Uncharacterized protein n=1 Tax=Forsythia ovata TaxID=205694 RepID=A0ABD1XBY2_9LAMI
MRGSISFFGDWLIGLDKYTAKSTRVPKFKIRRGGSWRMPPFPTRRHPRRPVPGPQCCRSRRRWWVTSIFSRRRRRERTFRPHQIWLDPCLLPGTLDNRRKRNQRSREGNRRPGRPCLPLLVGVNISTLWPAKDKLDLSVVEKLPPAVALAATSVYKYWTSSFGKAADTAEVTELMKLAEMYTSHSHVLNCELYKILEMKVDKIHSVIGEDEDAEAMRAKIKCLRARLAFSEDARTRATYDVTKA